MGLIRAPFRLVELSGFNVNKVQDHLLGKAFALASAVALTWFLLYLGVKVTDIAPAALKLLVK